MRILAPDQLRSDDRARAFEACAEIDAGRLAAFGLRYSDEKWEATHFAMDVPEKMNLSRLALDGDQRLLGFWIASKKPCGTHHTHRVATRPNSPGHKNGGDIPGLMGEAVLSAARRTGCTSAQLTVHEDNAGAIGLYERLGYRRLRGDGFMRAANALGYDNAATNDDVLELGPEYRLCLMSMVP